MYEVESRCAKCEGVLYMTNHYGWIHAEGNGRGCLVPVLSPKVDRAPIERNGGES